MNLFKRFVAKESIKTSFESFLKKNNVVYKSEVDKENQSTDYYFDYQGGHYVGYIPGGHEFLEVTFPAFHDVEIEHIDAVRSMCNHFNSTIRVFKVIYQPTEERDRVLLHLSFHIDHIDDSVFAQRLGACFLYQRHLVEYMTDAIKDANGSDAEMSRNAFGRQMFLTNQQEIFHQPGEPGDYHVEDTQRYPLGRMLDTLLGIKDITYCQLTVSTPAETRTIDDAGMIADTDLLRIMVKDDATGYNCDTATAVLHYRRAGSAADRYLSILLTPSGIDESSCYVRLTFATVPMALGKDNTLLNREQATALSIVMALDRESTEKKQQEFKYMHEDFVIRMRNGEQLTDDQKYLADITSNSIGYHFYWGTRHFNQGRYYEAIVHLENVYRGMRASFFDEDGKKHRDTFYRVCYLLGFCYNEVHNYELSFFYLNIVGEFNDIPFNMEYVNMLANSGDIRSFKTIEAILDSVKESVKDSDGDVPEQISDFAEFLQRRKGYTFIEFGLLDEAEALFKAMLDSPASHDYAVNELAHIQRLRRKDE